MIMRPATMNGAVRSMTAAQTQTDDSTAETKASPGMTPAMWWGVGGVALVFGMAVYRLGVRGLDTVVRGLTPGQWLALLLLTAVFVYGEGIRALQRRYIPHVMRRVELLRAEPRWWYRLLAPLHALTLIGASTRMLLKSWAGTIAIALAVVIVRSMPDPWRGIVDVAVASALAWGTLALLRAAAQRARAG
jgi:hypothetical protein